MSKHFSRRQREIRESQQVLNNVPVDVLTEADLKLVAEQCYHNDHACSIGTYTAVLFKYAVFFRNRWYFVVYNKDAYKVQCLLNMDVLSDDEIAKYNHYKDRLDNEMRIRSMNDNRLVKEGLLGTY